MVTSDIGSHFFLPPCDLTLIDKSLNRHHAIELGIAVSMVASVAFAYLLILTNSSSELAQQLTIFSLIGAGLFITNNVYINCLHKQRIIMLKRHSELFTRINHIYERVKNSVLYYNPYIPATPLFFADRKGVSEIS